MKAVILCLLIAGIAFAAQETVQPAIQNGGLTLAEIAKINELKQTKWGAIFFTMAELQMSAGPIERLVQALDDLVSELTKTNEDENSRYAEKKAAHEANVFTLNNQITEANNEIANNKNQINSVLTPRQTQAENQINIDRDQTTQKKNDISNAQNQRAKDHSDFLRRVDDHNNAISATDECIALINSLLNGTPSMVELKKATLSVRRLENKLRTTHFVETPLIEALIALVSSQNFADKNEINNVLSLLNEFRTRLVRSLDLENHNEAEAQKNFDEQMTQLAKEIQLLTLDIQTNTQIIQDTKKAIEECNNVIMAKNAELLGLHDQLDAENESFRKETITHEDVITEIAKEIEVVKECRQLFANKKFGAYASGRMGK